MRTRRLAVAAVALSLALAAACGVPTDKHPRSIEQLPAQTTTSTTSPAAQAGRHRVTVYYLRTEGDGAHLEARDLSAARQPSPATAIRLLFSRKAPSGLRSSIPAGTSVIDVTVRDKILVVNLTSEIENAPSNTEAFAQIVYTAVEHADYDGVTFRVDDKPVDVPTDRSDKRTVTRSDYAHLR